MVNLSREVPLVSALVHVNYVHGSGSSPWLLVHGGRKCRSRVNCFLFPVNRVLLPLHLSVVHVGQVHASVSKVSRIPNRPPMGFCRR
jgi:hypothetical protein